MIWKAKPVEPEPQDGDYKIVSVFAWWPTRVNDNMVWLESYQKMHEWVVKRRPLPYVRGMVQTVYMVFGMWELIGQKVKRGLPIYENMPPPPNSDERGKADWKNHVKETIKEKFKPII